MKEFQEDGRDLEVADMPSETEGENISEETTEESGQKNKKYRGLYSRLKISVKTLDRIIVACIAVIVITMLLSIKDIGFEITYNTLGGTAIETETVMYGAHIDESLIPEREGYTFTGWFLDEACTIPWDMEEDIIDRDVTLYAGWAQKIE